MAKEFNIDDKDVSRILTMMAYSALLERFSNDEVTIKYFDDMIAILVKELKEAKDGKEMEDYIREMLLEIFCSGYMIGNDECYKAMTEDEE